MILVYSCGLHSPTRNNTGSKTAAKTSWLRISCSSKGHVCWNQSFWNIIKKNWLKKSCELILTEFANDRKSLILQHCERSELRLVSKGSKRYKKGKYSKRTKRYKRYVKALCEQINSCYPGNKREDLCQGNPEKLGFLAWILHSNDVKELQSLDGWITEINLFINAK